jgi:SET domain-containing protein
MKSAVKNFGFNKATLPHIHTYARLKPSKIHGVGLFAIRDIKKGTDIFPEVEDIIIWIDKAKTKSVAGQCKQLYRDYCVLKDNKYACPVSFNLITPSWYINHSSRPNLYLDNQYRVYASNNIKKGQELTLDYTIYMDIKIPPSWKIL